MLPATDTPPAPERAAEVPEPVEAPEPAAKLPVADIAVPATPEPAAPPETELALLSEDKGPETVLAATAPEMPAEAATPGPLPLPGPSPADRLTGTQDAPAKAVPSPPAVNEFGLACGVIATAAVRPAAMVKLTLTAPCRGGERITVRHAGLTFSAQVDALGLYTDLVPAMERDAMFRIRFADDTEAVAKITVPQAEATERVALQYNGRTGLQIHALEFGADYGAAGHVWAGNARDAETAIKVGGGFLTTLGDPTLEAASLGEVYTLPANTTVRDGVVRLSVEAEVNADNCAKEVSGQAIQRQADGGMHPVSLTLSMPACDAIGEFLVLKNLLRDLKIASN